MTDDDAANNGADILSTEYILEVTVEEIYIPACLGVTYEDVTVEVLSSVTSTPQNIPAGCTFGTVTFTLENGDPLPDFFTEGTDLLASPMINENIANYTIVAELTFENEEPYTTAPFLVEVIPKYIEPEENLQAEIIDITGRAKVTIQFTIDISIVGKTLAEIDESILQITVESNYLTNNQAHIESWEVISQSGKEMLIDIVFKHPQCICMNNDDDQLTIVFLDPSPFQTARGTILPQGYTLMGTLPAQVEGPEADLLEFLTWLFSDAACYSPWRFVLYAVLACALQMVWRMLGCIQLIMLCGLGNLAIPGNLAFCFNLIANLLNFKLFPVNKLLSWFFYLGHFKSFG